MWIEFEGKRIEVPKCLNSPVSGAKEKQPYCGTRFNCNNFGTCPWAVEGVARRTRRLTYGSHYRVTKTN